MNIRAKPLATSSRSCNLFASESYNNFCHKHKIYLLIVTVPISHLICATL